MGMVLPDSLMGICMAENRNAEEHINNAPLVRLFKVVIGDFGPFCGSPLQGFG